MPLLGSLGGFAGPYGSARVVPVTYTLALVGGGDSANEGGNLQVSLTTTGIANGVTIPYTTSGTADANDFTSGSLSGNFTVSTSGTYPNGTATISFQVNSDMLTEGTENLRINAAGQSILVNLNDLSLSAPMWTILTLNAGDAGSRSLAIRGMAVSANGDTFSLYANGTTSNSYFQRLYPNNAVVWTKKYTANNFNWASQVEVEQNRTTPVNTDAVYFAGYASTAGSSNYAYITKANTAGGALWQRRLTISGGFDLNSISADHTGVALAEFDALVKYNTSGTLSWQKSFAAIPLTILRTVLCREGVTYVAAEEFSGSTGYNHMFKYNSSGSVLWKKQIGIGANTYTTCESMDTDSSSNLYFGGRALGTVGYMIKLNSSGDTVWARKVTGYEVYSVVYSDRDGYLYALGANPGNPYSIVLKMDVDGNVIWQRRLALSTTNNPRDSVIRVDPTQDYIYATNIQGGGLVKLNTDGGLGSFDSYKYSVSSNAVDDVTSVITNVNSIYNPGTSLASSTSSAIILSDYDNTLVQYRNTY